jgi:hypothetical protein
MAGNDPDRTDRTMNSSGPGTGDPLPKYWSFRPAYATCRVCGGTGRLRVTEQVPDRKGRPIPTVRVICCNRCGGAGGSY